MLNYCCFTIRCAEAITWENFFQTKRNPGSRKERFHLAGMRLSNAITGYNLWRVYNTARTELHLVQPGSCNHLLKWTFSIKHLALNRGVLRTLPNFYICFASKPDSPVRQSSICVLSNSYLICGYIWSSLIKEAILKKILDLSLIVVDELLFVTGI